MGRKNEMQRRNEITQKRKDEKILKRRNQKYDS